MKTGARSELRVGASLLRLGSSRRLAAANDFDVAFVASYQVCSNVLFFVALFGFFFVILIVPKFYRVQQLAILCHTVVGVITMCCKLYQVLYEAHLFSLLRWFCCCCCMLLSLLFFSTAYILLCTRYGTKPTCCCCCRRFAAAAYCCLSLLFFPKAYIPVYPWHEQGRTPQC